MRLHRLTPAAALAAHLLAFGAGRHAAAQRAAAPQKVLEEPCGAATPDAATPDAATPDAAAPECGGGGAPAHCGWGRGRECWVSYTDRCVLWKITDRHGSVTFSPTPSFSVGVRSECASRQVVKETRYYP